MLGSELAVLLDSSMQRVIETFRKKSKGRAHAKHGTFKGLRWRQLHCERVADLEGALERRSQLVEQLVKAGKGAPHARDSVGWLKDVLLLPTLRGQLAASHETHETGRQGTRPAIQWVETIITHPSRLGEAPFRGEIRVVENIPLKLETHLKLRDRACAELAGLQSRVEMTRRSVGLGSFALRHDGVLSAHTDKSGDHRVAGHLCCRDCV